LYISFKEIHQEQKQPLEYKIKKAIESIKNGFEVCQSRAAIAFSGGKDSTVLWHLIRKHFPEQTPAIIFGNTGVEYPESLKFARELGNEWGGDKFYEVTPERLKHDEYKYAAQVEILEWLVETGNIKNVLKADGKLKTTRTLEKACPPHLKEKFYADTNKYVWKKGTPKSYWWCVDQYGYPILGKAASKLKARRINIDCFLRFSESSSEKEELKEYYDLLRKVKISQACCDILKKEPSERKQAELKVDVIFKGLMAAESHSRKVSFSVRGYLFKSSRKYIDTPFYHCNPLAIWTDDDIWEYIRKYNVPYSPLYDLTYKDNKGNTCTMKRNGCMGCFTDYGRKDSHMAVLRQTHPARWKGIMKYGMAKEIMKLRTNGVIKKYARPTIIDAFAGINEDELDEKLKWAMEIRPCAFD